MEKPWTKVHCDFFVNLKVKFFHYSRCNHEMVRDISDEFCDNIIIDMDKFLDMIRRFDIPKTIKSNGVKYFTGFKFQSYFK